MSERVAVRRSELARSISRILAPTVALAVPASAVAEELIEELVVTASRRSTTVQDIPINITALGEQTIQKRRLVGLEEIARNVPGLQIVDRGPRDETPDIIVRGLNTDGLGPGFSAGTVATYIGDIPLVIDLKTNDIERVEVLIGPQGTLYGSGTLGGAIRYIPNRPDFDEFSANVHTRLYVMEESDGFSHDTGFVINAPLIDNQLALRASFNYLDDEGFIDYPFVVREAGVSNPQPDFNDPADVAANLRRVEDANGEQTLSGRVALRWAPIDEVDATLSYHFQNVEAEGRQLVHVESIGSGKYESGLRYEEPNDYDTALLSLEVVADLGFAELTSASGYSEYDELGQRDQTDLLLDFEYGYEFFPTFSAFTREIAEEEIITQELRLVSTAEGPFSWIVGYYFNKEQFYSTSEEFTPGFDQFAVDNFGGVQLRPDSLEYLEVTDDRFEEQAFFGEISYRIADAWNATIGIRAYEFEQTLVGGFTLPLFKTVFEGAPQDILFDADGNEISDNTTDDDGTLFKFNLSYDIDDDRMTYLTVSEGYRIGGLNSVPECSAEDIADGTQSLCALPDEILIKPDTTTNYELGLRSAWLGSRLIVNSALYYIDWEDIQVASVTDNGSLPITGNGSGAKSQGLEVSGRWTINDSWELSGTYAYNDAELTDFAEGLVGPADAPDDTRLPGSPMHQGTLNLQYDTVVWNDKDLSLLYTWTHMGNIFNIPGGDQAGEPQLNIPWDDRDLSLLRNRQGEKIPSYNLHSISATLSSGQWSAQLFVDNLYDEYAITGTRNTQRFLANSRGLVNGFNVRSYGRYIARPRTIGVSFRYDF